MLHAAIQDLELSMPSEKEAHIAQETSRKLAARLQGKEAVQVRLLNGSDQGSEVV